MLILATVGFRELHLTGGGNLSLSHFKQIVTSDYELSRVQSNVAEFLNNLINQDFINGNIISCSVGTTNTSIEHKLMREFKGWVIIDTLASADVWRVDIGEKNKFITLIASSACDIKIFVF